MINQYLHTFKPITLEEMKGVKLMNRTDTKYVAPLRLLPAILRMASMLYDVQETNNRRIASYDTLYYDTIDFATYIRHHNQHLIRQKVRIRTYIDSGLTFLEVKNKNNKGRTKKKRIAVTDHLSLLHPTEEISQFMQERCWYTTDQLIQTLYTRFQRITLVNKQRTERITIDMNVQWHNIRNGEKNCLGEVIVLEVKRDGNTPSPIIHILQSLRIHPMRMSKYCMGIVMTHTDVKHNRFLPKLRAIQKLQEL